MYPPIAKHANFLVAASSSAQYCVSRDREERWSAGKPDDVAGKAVRNGTDE